MRIAVAAAMMLLIVGGAGSARGQTPDERIDRGLARAREAGIPVSLLESKIAEGRAKGVSMERIAEVIERRAAALERARDAMRGRNDIEPSDLSVAADALGAGVSDAVLKAIADTAPRERRAVAIAALTQLVEQGHVPEAALERVREALQRGPEALATLPSQAGGGPRRTPGPPENVPGAGARGGAAAGPPRAVPAPGNPAQPAKPGGPPSTPRRPVTPPRPGSGGGSPGA